MSYTKVLKDCAKIADERQAQYGEASESIELCSSILKNAFDMTLNVSEICNVLVALKLSRQKNSHKDDNILDVINYLAISLYYNNTKK